MGMLGIHRGVDCGPSLTKQSFRDEVDINKIIARFERTGMISHVNEMGGVFGDVSEVGDYQRCVEVVQKADAAFMALPAGVRERFKNDPAELVAFIGDEGNREEAEKLGLVEKKVVEPVVQPEEVAPK